MLELKTYFFHRKTKEYRKRHKTVESYLLHGPFTVYFDQLLPASPPFSSSGEPFVCGFDMKSSSGAGCLA